MSMKSLFLSLFVSLALLLVGCGRSKPPSSKAATTETAAEAEATPPLDALPPQPDAAPAAAPATAAPAPAQPISFTPLPAGRDPAADTERQKLSEIRAKQAEALKREKAQRSAELQNQPESDRDQ